MRPLPLLGILILAALVVVALVRWRRRRRAGARERQRTRPVPPAWERALERNIPLYRKLSAEERERLHGHIQVFLAEKRFEGCGGLEITDEIRVTIAAQACLLLLNQEADYYPELRSILVYPSTVVPELAPRRTVPGEVMHEPVPVVGQSWSEGAVILTWDGVRRGAATMDDGRNVVFHEFAHQLDQATGEADGVPHMRSISAMRTWGRVMRDHYQRLREGAQSAGAGAIDRYGATNPAEFFAVATESFFERPIPLRREHPELYRELADYYRVDPAAWHTRS